MTDFCQFVDNFRSSLNSSCSTVWLLTHQTFVQTKIIKIMSVNYKYQPLGQPVCPCNLSSYNVSDVLTIANNQKIKN